MKCRTKYLYQTSEPIENLWEIRFSQQKATEIQRIARQNDITLSMTLRYCVFHLAEIIRTETDSGQESCEFFNNLPVKNLDFLKIPYRKPFHDLCHKKPWQKGEFSGLTWNPYCVDSIMGRIFSALQKCFGERPQQNKNSHRFMICLYGSDEGLLRHLAFQLGTTVALVICTAVEVFLAELERPEDVSNEQLLTYAIKQSIVMKFHNNYLEGKQCIGNYAIYSIYFPKWKYWPLKRQFSGLS